MGTEPDLTRALGQHKASVLSYVDSLGFPRQSSQVTYSKYVMFTSASSYDACFHYFPMAFKSRAYKLTLQIAQLYSAKPSPKRKNKRDKKPNVGFIQVFHSPHAFDCYFLHYFFLHKQVSNVTSKRRKRIFSLFSYCK